MADRLIAIGDAQFASRDGTAFSDRGWRRRSVWRWASQPLVGRLPDRQFVGRDDRIELEGETYSDVLQESDPLVMLREAASSREPQEVMLGSGEALGLWVVEEVSERRIASWPDGTPRAYAWSVRLSRYEGERAP